MSDTSDRNFVMILFIGVYFYMLTIQTKISLKNDWDNTKCNPLNLFTSSFYQTEQESSNQFGNCIKEFSKGVAKSELSSMVDKQNEDFKRVSSLANNNMNEINSTIKEKTNIIDKNYKETNKKIENTSSYLNTIKSYEETIPKKIEDFKTDVKDIFSRISTYMNK
jgi:hypothetical protein